MKPQNNNSGGLALFILVLIGLVLLIGPFLLPKDIDIPSTTKTILSIAGAVVLFFGTIGLIITKLYIKAPADAAIVRTGLGGSTVIVDGGAFVIPVVHDIKWVPTSTFKLEVERVGADALITADFLRADVLAVFFVNIQKKDEDVKAAAKSLRFEHGRNDVGELVVDKLVSALRTVAATQTLQQLNADRAAFAEAVQKIVEQELRPNGLTLESVAVSKLDQAPPNALNPDSNVFDAQGAKTNAEETARRRIERNKIENDARQAIAEQDAITARQVAEQNAQQRIAEAEAEQKAEQEVLALRAKTAIAQSEADQRAATAAAEQEKLAKTAKAQSDEAIRVAQVKQEQAVEVAETEKQKLVQLAGVEARKQSELALRQQQIAVANADKDKAAAEAERLEAERLKEQAAQNVETTKQVATAERQAQEQIIQQKAAAEKRKIDQETAADVAAYTVTKQASAEVEAAENKAKAKLVAAEADKQAAVLSAEGQRAAEMVPVEVDAKKVEVETARLKAQTENAEVALGLQIAIAAIQMQKEVGIAGAESMAKAFAGANVQIWGDPGTVAKMHEALAKGQATGTMIDSLMSGIPGLKDTIQSIPGILGQLGKGNNNEAETEAAAEEKPNAALAKSDKDES